MDRYGSCAHQMATCLVSLMFHASSALSAVHIDAHNVHSARIVYNRDGSDCRENS